MHRARAVQGAALVAGGLMVGLVLGELVTRRAMPELAPTGAGPTLYRHDDLLGWEKRPNVEVASRSGEWAVAVGTNRLGLRGPGVTIAKPPGTRRVLLLGDSFVEGYTVEQHRTVSSVLQRLLHDAGVGRVEVINGGTAGYSTDQELLFFERDGVRFEPDVVVLFVYLNDLAYNARESYWRGAKPYFELTEAGLARRGVPVPSTAWHSRELSDGLTRRSALYGLVRRAVTGGLRRPPGPEEGAGSTADAAASTALPPEFLPWQTSPGAELSGQWALTAALLGRLAELAEAAAARLLVFHVPSKPAIYDEVWESTRDTYGLTDEAWSPTADAQALGAVCARLALECILPVERFRSEAGAFDGPDALYFTIDGHWTATGHALAAELVAERLREARAEPPGPQADSIAAAVPRER